MYLLKHRILSSTIAGLIVIVVAYILGLAKVDDRVVLGIALALFNILDKLLLDGWRSAYLRKDLLESLKSFFRKQEERNKSQPLWENLQHQIKALSEMEPCYSTKELLHDALAEISSLRDHTSFIALDESHIKSLSQLKNFLEKK